VPQLVNVLWRDTQQLSTITNPKLQRGLEAPDRLLHVALDGLASLLQVKALFSSR
jgi:hypothetical protein